MPIIQSNPVDDASPVLCAGRKVTATHKALLWQLLNDDPACPHSPGFSGGEVQAHTDSLRK
jgi:hypothetical protein